MKTIYLLLVLFFYSISNFSQISINSNKKISNKDSAQSEILNLIDFNHIDNYAKSVRKYYSIESLASQLTDTFKTDLEKVRSIYAWMVNNIEYDYKELYWGQKFNEPEKGESYQDFYYRTAKKILYSKKAMCGGYAQLFYELCKASKIKCYVVLGITERDPMFVRFFRKTHFFNCLHAWNKVLINKQWYYIDVTWADGDDALNINNPYYLVRIDDLYQTHVDHPKFSRFRNDIMNNRYY